MEGNRKNRTAQKLIEVGQGKIIKHRDGSVGIKMCTEENWGG
jgi:hypothetical protein